MSEVSLHPRTMHASRADYPTHSQSPRPKAVVGASCVVSVEGLRRENGLGRSGLWGS